MESSSHGVKQLCLACGKEVGTCQCSTVKVTLEEEAFRKIAQAQTLSTGDIEGRYKILEKIGVGGMGTVYRAEHIVLRRQVAVKVLRAELLTDTMAMARFEQESRALAALSHPNLVAVYDCGITSLSQPYLVMEFLSGKNLMQIVKESGALPVKTFFDIFVDVANGLSYAHSHGVIHRDLKPSNILLNEDPRGGITTKIVDFGVAKIEDLGGEFQMLTRTGEVFGSPAYMSPEQCQGNIVDQRSDIYALGCVMYEAISGRQAFKGANIMTIMSKQMEDYPPPPERFYEGSELPLGVQQLVMKCLQKDPIDRFQSMQELKEALEEQRDRLLLDSGLKIGNLRLPSFTVPTLVSLAILLCLATYWSFLPGGSLTNWASALKKSDVASKAMLGAYAHEKDMDELSQSTFRSLITGPESQSITLPDRCAMALFHFAQIYDSDEGCREILSLFGRPISALLEEIEKAAVSDPKSVSQASWSAPLLYYYAGGAQERENNWADAPQKYMRGITLASKMNSPKWVKAKLQEELGEVYMDQPNPQPERAIPPLKESLRLLMAERPNMRAERRESLKDTVFLLFRALNKTHKTEEAADVLKSHIEYLREQKHIDKREMNDSLRKLVEHYELNGQAAEMKNWLAQLNQYEASIGTRQTTVSDESAPYTVLLIQGFNQRTDELKNFIHTYLKALTVAENKHAPELDRLAIAALAMQACSEYSEFREAEELMHRMEPVLAKLKKKLESYTKKGTQLNTGHASVLYYYAAQTEWKGDDEHKARALALIDLSRAFSENRPEETWISGKLDSLEARILSDLNKDLPKAEKLAKSAAEKMFRVAGPTNFRVADAYWTLGRVYDKEGKYQEARQAINKAIAGVNGQPWNEWHINSEYRPELENINAHAAGK